MPLTRIRAKETVRHLESRTWHSDDLETRFHRYECKVCHTPFVWEEKPYEKCPWCGFPVTIYREQR